MQRTAIATGLLAAFLAPMLAQAAQQEGRTLYAVYCTQCHGIDGDGKGLNVEHMTVLPRDHTNRQEMGGRSDEELFRVIQRGGSAMNLSVLMPAWGGNLSDEQIEALVQYLRALCCEQ